ncbi:CBD9-like protein [Sporothrix schenckii 1099-18]|uniref:Cellobiose dehydrogenase-like cytochrome domain-containing protein n=2 Tax=Sporothrix schenckii TaxID=29908 RepID=U7PUR0_SPOS1|nr:CBD9-like protein [Sporothrix schenckii 1099-18]ERS98681.1 hypothetical protein HMPREF1624_05468 [Sporothrix schenckii ATCC 58251]KJR89130.1 CBD9-like protein [Sporothrix schenckii 1099-18]
MRVAQLVPWGAVLSGFAASPTSAAPNADTSVYHDSETGFTFTQYNGKYTLNNAAITFRVAVPSGVPANTNFDVVLQIVAPRDVGWAGLAWGGGMTQNPLAAAWGTSTGAIISSRWATGHYLPQAYAGSTYQIFKKGTKNNGTHWQVTAKCSGCTSYAYGSSSIISRLSPTGSNRFAFAYSALKPSNPSLNTSDFGEHSVIGYWNHDFGSAANPSFTSLVAKNL